MAYLRKFGPDDKLINRMETRPQYEVLLYPGKQGVADPTVLINNRRFQGVNIPSGTISLFEMNVDRAGTAEHPGSLIYRFLVKDGTYRSFSSISTSEFNSASYGDVLTGSLPLSATVSREYISPVAMSTFTTDQDSYFNTRKKMLALKNTLYYNMPLSPDYSGSWIDTGTVNMIQIPSVMYGSKIHQGSVSLKFYYTGSLLDEAKDSNKDGRLISTMRGTSGSTVGMVLYNEGIILLTSSVTIPQAGEYAKDDYTGTGVIKNANWTFFGAYSNAVVGGSAGSYATASLGSVSFKGTHKIPVLTMFTNLDAGLYNNSQNPTWVSSSVLNWRSDIRYNSGSYVEPTESPIKNTIQSQYCDYEDKFEKQVFVDQVGIFDEERNLLAIAKLANPVLKKESDSFTVKLKLDM
jgi:hypothetical protein